MRGEARGKFLAFHVCFFWAIAFLGGKCSNEPARYITIEDEMIG
ncbi:MAG: hypothetical protein ABI216_04330 [Devosia sp.]